MTKSNWIKAAAGALGVVIVLAVAFRGKLHEIYALSTYSGIFEPAVIDQNFRTLHQQYPSVRIPHTAPLYDLPSKPQPLPAAVDVNGKSMSVGDWLQRTKTNGFLIVKDGVIVSENYYRGYDQTTPHILMSVTKSVVSLLVGIAHESGLIASLNDPVDKYAPMLKQGGYAGVSIKNVLQMSSGVRWVEDYGDLNSEVVRYIVSILTGSVDEFASKIPNERPAGTYNKYVSADTQVLTMVLQGATGKPLSELLEKHVWSKLGMEHDAWWLVDAKGQVAGAGGLNAIPRDMARIGLLYLNEGRNFQGQAVVSPKWIKSSVTPDAPHLMPGKNPALHDWSLGYGYQWWIPENAEGGYSAIGIFGQFIYIFPERKVIIVKTSAYDDYFKSGSDMELETLEVFKALAKAI